MLRVVYLTSTNSSVAFLILVMIWNPSTVYITEITRKDVRGPLVSLGTTFIALGKKIIITEFAVKHFIPVVKHVGRMVLWIPYQSTSFFYFI